jgi:hypothetical protein
LARQLASSRARRTISDPLDQKDHLTVLQQRSEHLCHHRLRAPSGHNDNDISTIDCGSEIARRALDRSEAASLALDIHPAARSDFGEPRIVDIVEPQLEPGYAQLGDQIETTDTRPDNRNRLHCALVRHRPLPNIYSRLTAEITPSSAGGSIRLALLFLLLPTRGQRALRAAENL